MKSRAIFILCTFIILFAINKFSLHKDIKKQNEDISIVNISGKQRMYSQKISKLTLLFRDQEIESSEQNSLKLKEISTNFTKAHLNLTANYLKKYDDYFLEDYFKKLEPYYLSITSNTYLLLNSNKNQKLRNEYINEIKLASDGFLPIMDEIVTQYEIIGKKRGTSILNREFTFNIFIAVLSIYSVFFLIFPLINSKKDSLS